MAAIEDFDPELENLLPVTAKLLKEGGLVVHEGVAGVILEGSRGLKGGFRPDSDIDLTLFVDNALLPNEARARSQFLDAVINMTLEHWHGAVELDTAAAFDTGNGLGLRLFSLREYDQATVDQCTSGGGFGLYKTQKGFNGYVPFDILDLKLIYPMLTIWRKHPIQET